ncbi:gluconate 2-dehydrogenase subunit 3 family protein [Oligoflexia bacterium]|nr:gluconate 2-dehydrogenase subunit 3 family protein [Oligoflexia bacterium]
MMDRRHFLFSTLLSTLSSPLLFNLAGCWPKPGRLWLKDKRSPLPSAAWQLIAAVQEHLLPSSPNTPGAKDANALAYLQFVLLAPDADAKDLDLIKNGVSTLDDLAQTTYQRSFIELSADQRETVLRSFEEVAGGQHWIATILNFIFEALLSAPSYGGNVRGVGWKWLKHNPGFPLPPKGKRYYEL